METPTTNRITVDYLVPLTVNIDLTTGRVDRVSLHLDSFQDTDEVRVFAGCSGDPTLPEYLPLTHPLAKRMVKLAEGVSIYTPEFDVLFTAEIDE